MADDVVLPGTGETVAADEIGGKKYQRVKVAVGADGSASDLAPGQATKANSLPVVLASDQGALPVSDNGGSLTVDGPLTDTQLRATAVPVSLASVPSHPVTNAGTFPVQATLAAETTKVIGTVNVASGQTVGLVAGSAAIGKLAANSGVDIGDVDVTSGPTGASAFQVQGTVAHDGVAANNPVLNAGFAVNAEPAAVANGDVARLLTDLVGKLITLPYANPENFVAGKTADITGTSDTAVIAAQGAGVRIYVTHIIVTNSHATVGTFVLVKDGSTEIYNGYAAAAGGGFALTLPVPLRLTANTALNVACATTGANVRASASGYKGV